MLKYPTLFKVNLAIYDNGDVERGSIRGILFSEGWADAAQQLQEYYGDEIESIEIELFEDGVIEFPEAHYETIYNILSGSAGINFTPREVS